MVIVIVNLHSDAYSLLAEFVHLGVYRTSGDDRVAGIHNFDKLLGCHFTWPQASTY